MATDVRSNDMWQRLIKVIGVVCPDGRERTFYPTAEADTYFSVPGRIWYKGKSVAGSIMTTYEGVTVFHPNQVAKNGYLFADWAQPFADDLRSLQWEVNPYITVWEDGKAVDRVKLGHELTECTGHNYHHGQGMRHEWEYHCKHCSEVCYLVQHLSNHTVDKILANALRQPCRHDQTYSK